MSAIVEQELTTDTTPRRRWPVPITWLGLITLAWALYELTAQPAIGAMALCLKLGWDDFRTACWLRRRDPSRKRGRTCFWLYLANGAWKVTVSAVLACEVIIIIAVERQGGRWGQQTEELLVGTALTVGVGWLISLWATLLAVWLAWRNGLKLWLHSAVHHAWHADSWPPHLHGGGRRNRLEWLLVPQSVLAVVALGTLLLIGLIMTGDLVIVGIGCGVMLIASCVLGNRFRDISFEDSLRAKKPEQCWGVVLGDEREEEAAHVGAG